MYHISFIWFIHVLPKNQTKIFIQGISVSASADIDISKVDVYFNAEMCLSGDGCSLQIQVNHLQSFLQHLSKILQGIFSSIMLFHCHAYLHEQLDDK